MAKLDIIIGTMFAGKSLELIRRIRLLKILKTRYIVVKPEIDTRMSTNNIVSHDLDREECIPLETLSILLDWHDIIHSKIDTIFIDEAQFFVDLETVVNILVDTYNINVIVAGLKCDAKRQKFGQVIDLIPRCDNVMHLTALCVKCMDGTPATFPHKLVSCKSIEMDEMDEMEDQVDIGGSDKYISVCREHYNKLHEYGFD